MPQPSPANDYHLGENIAALKAAAAEHDRVFRNAQRAQRILEAEIATAQQLEELQAQEAERVLAERRVYLAREQERQAKAELAAREEAIEITSRIPTPKAPSPAPQPKQRPSLQPPPVTAVNQSESRPERPPSKYDQPQVKAEPAAPVQASAPAQPSAPLQPSQPTPTRPTAPPTATNPTLEHTHQQYLDLHQRLKTLRKDVFTAFKTNPTAQQSLQQHFSDLKLTTIGDLRREIKKRVTQLTADPRSNIPSINALRNILIRSQQTGDALPTDPSLYIIRPQNHNTLQSNSQGIAALLPYLLNIFAKSILRKHIVEARDADRFAEPAGIAAITIFASPDLRFGGESFIDIILAKYHHSCPVLFGISGSEKTEQGRKRLGWAKNGEGGWVTEQDHFDRMTGLAAGFGALSLRDFSKARSPNPFPPHHYWISLAGILNTPTEKVMRTHCVVLKALVEIHVEKFVGFYGGAAVAVLKVVVGAFVERVERTTESASLGMLREVVRGRCALTL